MANDRNQEAIRTFLMSAATMLSSLEILAGDDESIRALSKGPVGLRDTNRYRHLVKMVDRDEIGEARREIASALAMDNFAEGFALTMRIIGSIGAIV